MRVFDQRLKELGYDDTTFGAKVGKSSKTIYNWRRPDNPTNPDHPTAVLVLELLNAQTWGELMAEAVVEEQSVATNA